MVGRIAPEDMALVLMHSLCYLLVFYQFDHCIVTIKWKRIDKRLEMNTDI